MPLTHTKKDLKTVLEHISDGVLFLDHKGKIKFYNRALEDLLSIHEDLTGVRVSSLPEDNPLRQAIFRADQGFSGPYCWEMNNCPADMDCPGKTGGFCRCWTFNSCSSLSEGKRSSCIDCDQYLRVKRFLEKPKELAAGEKTLSVLSSFIENSEKKEIWEVIVFKDVTSEKLDAVMKLAGATAHELRQPLQIILSCASLIEDKVDRDQDLDENFKAMKESCLRINSIIEKINRLVRYKTKHYILSGSILDIEESSDKDGKEQ